MKKRDFYLSIIELVRSGLTLKQVAIKLNLSKQSLNYYISRLKRSNVLIKKGYGVWEINEREVKNALRVGSQNSITDRVRGHGFQFILRIPNLKRWQERETYLKGRIEYKNILTSIQSLKIKDHKVWLAPRSIVVYFPSYKSYFTDTSKEAKNYAIYDFLTVINKLEKLLKISLRYGKDYQFRIGRQHYALIKNALAVQYDKEGRKLEVRDKDGLWLLIDNSFNLHELETVHPKTADIDNQNVLDLFNSVKKQPITSAIIYNLFEKIGRIQEIEQQKWSFYAENIESHTKAIIGLEKGINRLFKYLKKK